MDREKGMGIASEQHLTGTLIGTTEEGAIYRRLDDSGEELPVLVVCKAHIDQGIDEFVDEYEQPPDLYRLDDVRFTSWQPPETCVYCKDKPVFLVL
jgi:CxxH/CxxC protein (TIGR04129 family)